ncbi:hypothetical protein [Krasilnikovia sp. MM14-A1004]|uniref:hypothetical protein n=1 Tax=Krasilnikovia sp. MM14-A1004 TaxID=3373541 RepID=UPI00399CE212
MFYGREKLEDLVTGLVRVDRNQAVPVAAGPVIALEGTGGSGRSAALRFLADQHAAALPVAVVDAVADAAKTTTFDEVSILLLTAASELAESPAGFGRIPFHRLFLGHLALAQPIDPDATPEQRQATMAAALKSYRKRRAGAELIGQVLSEVAVGALDHAGGDALPGLGAALRPLTTALTRTRLTRGSALRDAERWYADQLTDGRRTPAAGLARLHRWWQSEAARGQVEEILVRAFLADLRAAATRRFRRSGWRRWRAELLLDNADSPAGQRLSALLCEARTAVPPAPLVVVAASGGESLPAPSACAADRSRALSEVEAAALPRHELHALQWLRITLPPLTRAETITAVAERDVFDHLGVHRVARVTHRLSGGHPLATTLVLDALGRQTGLLQDVDKLLDGEPVDPETHRARTLADEILLGMTERTHATIRPSGSFRDTFVVLAAARDLEEADRLTRTDHLRSARPQDLRLALSDTLWPRSGGARRLAAPARFLALRELAARPEGHPHSRARVFRTLLTLADDDVATAEPERLLDARTASLHYQLALGEVRSVAVALAHLLPGLTAPAWLGILDDIVATPDPLDPLSGADDPTGLFDALPLAVGRLVVALRRLGDPRLTDPEVIADLRLLVADQYRDVARAATHQSREYRNRAARYELPDDEH